MASSDFPTSSEMFDDFPAIEEFEQINNAIPFREVEQNTPFEIMEIIKQPTKNGESTIVTLKRRDGTTINSWATSLIEKKLESMKSGGDGKRKYILSRGRRTSERTGTQYYDFKIICK